MACLRIKPWLGSAVVAGLIISIWLLVVAFFILFHLPLLSVMKAAAPVAINVSACSAVVYNGEVCRTHLKILQDCLPGHNDSSEIYVSSSGSEMEQQVGQFLSGLAFLNPTPECREVVEPFLCLYVFGLCDSSGELYLPSSGECETLTTETCAREWTMAQMFLPNDQLPKCESLPEKSSTCNRYDVMRLGDSTDTNTTDQSGPNTTCADEFYLDEVGICQPHCGRLRVYLSRGAELAASGLILAAAVIGIISGLIVITLSFVHYKCMFAFPSVLIRYQTATIIMFNTVLVMGSANHEYFHCSSKNLLESFRHRSPFCTYSGVVFFYTYCQATVWWLCHIAAMFWGLQFPFQAHQFEAMKKTKYIHLAVVLLGLLLPLIPVVVSLATGGFEFARFPPITCSAASTETTFYSLVSPTAIADAVGLMLLILIFWIIGKGVSKRHSKVPEVKILIIVSYFLASSVLALIAYSLTFWRGNVVETLSGYILCQSTGIQPGKLCSKSGFNTAVAVQAMLDVVTVLFAFVPVVNLLYAVNFSNSKRLRKCFQKRKLESKLTFT